MAPEQEETSSRDEMREKTPDFQEARTTVHGLPPSVPWNDSF
jgi:hypothetical protein